MVTHALVTLVNLLFQEASETDRVPHHVPAAGREGMKLSSPVAGDRPLHCGNTETKLESH